MTNIILRANDQHAHQKIDPERTAIIIIDVWDDHWCKHYKKLNDLLAERLAPAIDRFRAAGVKIILVYLFTTIHRLGIMPFPFAITLPPPQSQ